MQSSNEGEGSRVAKKLPSGAPGFVGFFTNNEPNAAQNPRQEVPALSYQGSRLVKNLPAGTPGFRGVFAPEDSSDTNDIVIQGTDCTITITRN